MRCNYAAIQRWIDHDNRMKARAAAEKIAQAVKANGGRLAMEQLRANFGAYEIERAIEEFRTIHPVSVETRQGVATFYEAN
jgi:hypothetical protein